MNVERLLEATAAVKDRLERQIEPVLAAFPIAKHVALLDAHPAIGGYKYRSSNLVHHCARIKSVFPYAVTQYNAVVVLALMQRSLTRADTFDLTPEILEICVANFVRIVRNIDTGDIAHMTFQNDRFDKELAAASMRLLCGGARKFHLARLPRSLARRHPCAWARCAMRIGLRGNLYRMHVDSDDPFLLAEFNPDGWRRFCRRAADLLRRKPVEGLIGTTWYYDPELKHVSPRLGYLRTLIMENGGISVRMGTTAADIVNATSTSATRRRLYERGEYVPVGYTLIWLKRDLLRWAALDHDPPVAERPAR